MRCIPICIIPITALLILSGCASNKYNTVIKQVETHIRYKRYDSAENQIKNLIKSHPEKPEPYYLYGVVSYSKGNYYDCLLYFDKAERNGYTRKENIYLRKGIALYHTGNLMESESLLSRSLTRNPTPETWKLLGILRFELSDYTGAIEPLEMAVKEYPNDVRCNYYLGLSLFREGRNKESLQYFNKAAELDPKDPEIIFHTANSLMLNGQNRKAAVLYSTIPPESVYGDQGIYNSAEAYINLGEYTSAVQLLTYLAEKKPDDYNVRFNLSAALLKTGDFARAVSILATLYEDNRHDARMVYNFGLAHKGMGNMKSSLRYFKEAVALNPGNPDFRYAYGLELAADGQDDEALRQMETVLKLDSGYTHAGNWIDNHRNF